MPWKVCEVMDERVRFIQGYESGLYGMSELWRQFGISRETGYKYVRRYKQHGLDGLQDLSRAPHSCPHRMAPELSSLLLEARDAHPTWGPRKQITRVGIGQRERIAVLDLSRNSPLKPAELIADSR